MKFKRTTAISGTHLIDYVTVSYKTLKTTFGKPEAGDGYKVDAEWGIKFEDGTVATVYNYKTGKNYDRKNGIPKTQITNWHIGGTSDRAAELVIAAIQNS